ncbi:hypothetical protein [Exiguobacterium sp.]|uniref:hypothetical protein n=1 Tax=Exiguobacterium sp. TaxID=44751 RepID=UPI00289747B3|nr:hypothetical protein [Exiguobacterium sp.]
MKKELKTSIEGKTLRMEWTCEAPRDSVFAAFTEKEQLEAWWGPEGWETTLIVFESTYETEAAVQEVLGMGMKEGFTSQLYRLDRLLTKR